MRGHELQVVGELLADELGDLVGAPDLDDEALGPPLQVLRRDNQVPTTAVISAAAYPCCVVNISTPYAPLPSSCLPW